MDDWRPELAAGDAPLYRRLTDALARDIGAGTLRPGMRLPPQRLLADRLGLSVGTVTKAYEEAEQRGLVAGHVGRGTFIAERAPSAASEEVGARGGPVDLAWNVIPIGAATARFADTLGVLRRRSDLLDLLSYAPPAGQEAHRRAAVRWIAQACGLQLDWSRLAITAGAQQGLSLALGAVCARGETVLCEAATFNGMKSLAENAGLTLAGVAMDAEGMLPSALDRIARATSARALYVMPTVQNPTGRSMGADRRAEIVRIARRHDLWIVEDDNYALFAPAAPLPRLAELAPERTFHVSGLAKSLAPGLRTGFLTSPTDAHAEAVVRTIRAQLYAPSAFGALVFVQWLEDGSATAIAEACRREVAERYGDAQRILSGRIEPLAAPSPHVWLPCNELDAERIAGLARRLGAAVTPPAIPFLPGAPVSGLRVCIGAPATRAELQTGLSALLAAIAGSRPAADLGVV
jgi:DNA-binding transcriptional MocR family regulator